MRKEAGELDLPSILRRVAELSGVKRGADIARELDMTHPALANAKSRGSIPYERLIAFARKSEISLDYLLWGSGPQVSPALFARAARAFDEDIGEVTLPRATRDLCVVMVYNDISTVPEEQLPAALERSVRRVTDLLKSLGATRRQAIDEPDVVAQRRQLSAREQLERANDDAARPRRSRTTRSPKK